jgi:aspartate/methionine/tyrosine aminotransferase
MFLDQVKESPSLEVVNLVLEKKGRGEKVTSLAIGDPSFQTPKEIVNAAYQSMKEGTTFSPTERWKSGRR